MNFLMPRKNLLFGFPITFPIFALFETENFHFLEEFITAELVEGAFAVDAETSNLLCLIMATILPLEYVRNVMDHIIQRL